jgi:hypothetical protein
MRAGSHSRLSIATRAGLVRNHYSEAACRSSSHSSTFDSKYVRRLSPFKIHCINSSKNTAAFTSNLASCGWSSAMLGDTIAAAAMFDDPPVTFYHLPPCHDLRIARSSSEPLDMLCLQSAHGYSPGLVEMQHLHVMSVDQENRASSIGR